MPGIIFFSTDNGNTWKNASAGLPRQVSVGIDGIDVSAQQIGVATKEYGVYLYDTGKASWSSIPTAKEILEGNIGALALYHQAIFVGAQHKGLFRSTDGGDTWIPQHAGWYDLTIRRFVKAGSRLYACTNDGFYVYDEQSGNW